MNKFVGTEIPMASLFNGLLDDEYNISEDTPYCNTPP